MNRFIFVLSLLGSALLAENSVVKVASYPCDRPSSAKLGSGTLVKHSGKTFVLTSDHVLFHGNSHEGICHRVYPETLPKGERAELKAVNLLKGLGLLFLPDAGSTLAADAVEASSLWTGPEIQVESFARLCGYPHGSHRVLCDRHAQVIQAKSDRTILPKVRTVVEVNGHNEYGMSGGALFTDRWELLGVLSHQYLQIVEGKPAKLYETKEGMASGQVIGLVIPRKEVGDWLRGALLLKADDVRWEISSQLKKKSVISFEGVRFTPKECILDGDPIGVGGDVTVEGTICEVVLTLDKSGTTHVWPLAAAPWFSKTKERLLAGATATINGIFYKGRRYPLGNMLNLLSKIEDGIAPTISLSDPFTALPEVVKQLAKVAPKIKEFAGELTKKYSKNSEMKEFLNDILLVGELCENRQFELVDLHELRVLLEQSLWTQLMVEELELSYQLKAALLKTEELLKKIKE